MNEIDFLPAEYRQKRGQRHAQPWRVVVVAGFAALVAIAAFGQNRRLTNLDAQLAEVVPRYEAAAAGNEELKGLAGRIERARADAELFTYLRHRWPATQILDGLLAPLPDEIIFERLEIHDEASAGGSADERLSRADREAESERRAALPAAARDLEALRSQFDKRQTIVTIAGLTTDSAVLHRYLGELSRRGLFAKAELDAIESDPASGKLRFRVSLAVRPGYGQPGGPAPAPSQAPLLPKPPTPGEMGRQA